MLDPPRSRAAGGSVPARLDGVLDAAVRLWPGAANCSAASLALAQLIGPDLLTRRAMWLPVGAGRRRGKRDGDPARAGRRPTQGAIRTASTRLPDRPTPPTARRRRVGRAQGQLPDDHGDDAARLPDRRAVGALSRGIRAAQPLDRHDRGQDQQPRRGAVDHLRPARPRGVPQLHAPAALGAAGRRADAGADDHAGDRHRRAQRDQVGAAVDPRCRAWASARRRCRSCSTMSCRWRCPAS